MFNLRSLLPMIPPGVFNDPAEEEKRKLQKRLADELLTRGSVPLGGVEPPPVDPMAAMELARNATYRPTNPELPPSRPSMAVPALQPPMALERTPAALPEPLGAPPIMIRRSGGGRPLEAIGGGDALTRDRALLEAQQGYKQPFSKKDFLLSSLSSFLRGGLPGVAGNAIGMADPNYRKQMSMGSDIAETEGRIKQGMLTRKLENDWKNDQSQRDWKQNQITRSGDTLKEQERDNLRQLYNSQPFFDASKNPQHKILAERAAALGLTLPNRDEKDSWSLEKVDGVLKRVSKTTGKVVDTGLINRADVPVVEDGLTVTPGQALNARATRENRDFTRGEKQTENTTKRAAKLREAQTLQSNAEIYENNAREAEKDLGNPNVDQITLATQVAALKQEAQQLRRQAVAARAEGESIPDAPPLTRNSGGYTEADVRARATAAGKDAEAAVALAKSKGLLK